MVNQTPSEPRSGAIEVACDAGPQQVYLGLGANLAQPAQRLALVCEQLRELPETRVVAVSSFYESDPLGPPDQPRYVNAVCELATELTPLALLDHTQALELQHKRDRSGQRWGARTLDIDILLYAQEIICSERLTVPHPGITQRSFVLLPLLEIQPEADAPGLGPLADYLVDIDLLGIVKLATPE